MGRVHVLPSASLSILLVEDDELVAYSLAALLRRRGHQVEVASTGEAALEAAQAGRPDVALVDIGLPGAMDGLELARCFRERAELRDVVLVALTGLSDDESRRLSAEAGFRSHLSKPVSFEELDGALAMARPPLTEAA